MPYSADNKSDIASVKKKLKKTYKNISDTAARQAIHVFNSVMDSSNDEGKAWASVYSSMNKRNLTKKQADSTFVSVGVTPEDLHELSEDMIHYAKLMGYKAWENHSLEWDDGMFVQAVYLDTRKPNSEALVTAFLQRFKFKEKRAGLWLKDGVFITVIPREGGAILSMKLYDIEEPLSRRASLSRLASCLPKGSNERFLILRIALNLDC